MITLAPASKHLFMISILLYRKYKLKNYISSRAKRGRVLPEGYKGTILLEEIEKSKDAAPE